MTELVEVAEAQIRLVQPDDKGLTLTQRFLADEAAGIAVPDWRPPDPPLELAHVWKWWCELDAGRHFRDDGRPVPISYVDIVAWAWLTGRAHLLGPFETRIIRQLDAVYFEVKRNPVILPTYLSETVDTGAHLKAIFRVLKSGQKKDKKFLS